jgi:hypothetical protein
MSSVHLQNEYKLFTLIHEGNANNYISPSSGFKQGFGSGSGLDPYSIGPLDPDPDP